MFPLCPQLPFSDRFHTNCGRTIIGRILTTEEQRRRVGLWYAYRRVHGVLHKRYVGKSAGLTWARLEETAVMLNEVW